MQPIVDLLGFVSDERRPMRLAQVESNAYWSPSGPSFVDVNIDGARRRVIYRDGIVPLVGSHIQVQKMDSGVLAGYIGYPLAPPPPNILNCEYTREFLVNFVLADPPDKIPGNLFGKALTMRVTLGPACRNVYGKLRYWVLNSSGVITRREQIDEIGPVDGPLVFDLTVGIQLFAGYYVLSQLRTSPFLVYDDRYGPLPEELPADE